jgi:FKBP-type peptidyl-prolyl cis-trans isomerase
MKRYIFIIIILIPVGAFAFCQPKWSKTPSGIYYKVYSNDTTKPKPFYGDHIWMHLRKFSTKKKEIFNTKIFDITKGVEMDYKKPEKNTDVTEIFRYLGIGDSAFVKIRASEIDSNGSKKKYYTYWLNLLDFKRQDIHYKEKKERFEQQKTLDSLAIIDYIRNAELNQFKEDENGNWFLLKQHGTEKIVKVGDSITIHYKGKLLNGNEFDNSYDRKQTFTFVVGKRQVIDGLDIGIQHFYVGDKCTLIIPSRLGYGDKEVGKIPANSVLIFEMEILE